MKKIFSIVFAAIVLAACNNSGGDGTPVVDSVVRPDTSTSINQSTGTNAVPDTSQRRPDSAQPR